MTAQSVGALPLKKRSLFPRRVALLGGTTSIGDCIAAASFLFFRPHHLVEGKSLRRYELAFAEYIGVRHGYSFSSGRVALSGILRALDIGEGDDVLVQVPTHIVVANAVRFAKAHPIFVDSSFATCNMDVHALEQSVTSRTKAIVLQHTFGIPGDLNAVLKVAGRRGITVIEDCVHAMGAKYRGARLGSIGRAAFFSTEETKTISTTMGGMALTNDDELAVGLQTFQQGCSPPSASLTARYLAKLVAYHMLTQPHLYRYTRPLYEAFGRRNPLPGPMTTEEIRGVKPDGYERRFSNAQAVLGLRQLRRIEGNLMHREKVSAAFKMRLEALGFDMPHPPSGSTAAHVRLPVYVEDQQAAVAAAAGPAVLGTWFTSVLEEAVDPLVGGYVAGSCPVAELLSQRIVNLPTHERVSAGDIESICEALSAVKGQSPNLERADWSATPWIGGSGVANVGSTGKRVGAENVIRPR